MTINTDFYTGIDTLISHNYDFGSIIYNDDGVVVLPALSRHRLLIPWYNISFFSPVPAVKKKNGVWETFDGTTGLMAHDALETVRFFYMYAIRNRHELKPGKLSLAGSMLFWAFFPKNGATAGIDDKPSAEEGYLKFKIRKKSLTVPLCRLLDLIEKKSRFGILCATD